MMATLERQKPKETGRQSTQTLTDTCVIEFEVERLMLEPMEYDEHFEVNPMTSPVDIASPIMEKPTAASLLSLESLCQTSLTMLDMLLQKMSCMSGVAYPTAQPVSVIESIAANTSLLARATVDQTTASNCALRSSPIEVLQSVARLLESPYFYLVDRGDGCRAFGRALTALTMFILPILERCSQHATQWCTFPSQSALQIDNTQSMLSMFEAKSADDCLMNINETLRIKLAGLVQKVKQNAIGCDTFSIPSQPPPPPYAPNDGCFVMPQVKKEIAVTEYSVLDEEKHDLELESVLSALERISLLTPRFNDQRVALAVRCPGPMTQTALKKDTAVKPVSHATEWHCRTLLFKSDKLYNLITEMCRSVAKAFDHRRINLHIRRSQASVSSDVCSYSSGEPTQHCSSCHPNIMYQLADLLVAHWYKPQYIKQRYLTSRRKERDMFLKGLLNKLDRLEGRRMSDQDADPPRIPTHRSAPGSVSRRSMSGETDGMDEELLLIMNRIYRAERCQLNNQRAQFSTGLCGISAS